MTSLQIVPCHIAGIGSAIVLLEVKIVSNSPRDGQVMWVKDFIHIALACKCALNYNQHRIASYTEYSDWRSEEIATR